MISKLRESSLKLKKEELKLTEKILLNLMQNESKFNDKNFIKIVTPVINEIKSIKSIIKIREDKMNHKTTEKKGGKTKKRKNKTKKNKK